MKKYYLVLLTMLVMMPGSLAVAKPGMGSYHLLKKIPLGEAPGGESFDYLVMDPQARRVYVTHGSEVAVINADTLTAVGKISGMKKNHGVAIVTGLGKGYITDGDGNEVVVFDVKTFKVIHRIPGLVEADNIIYDPVSKHVFTFNGNFINAHAKDFGIIDPKTDTLLKKVELPGAPEASVADGKGTIYHNCIGKNEVVVIDTKAGAIKAEWTVTPEGGEPTPLSMDRQHRRLFSSGRTPATMVVMDADNGKVLQSFPISDGADSSAFDPATGLVYVSTRAGKVHIFHEDSPDKVSEVETVSTEYGAKTMALDPKTHNIFLTTSDFGPPPAPTPERPHPNRPQIVGTARVLVYGR
jgi:DNA-binding beta-propeller fold protein YncE